MLKFDLNSLIVLKNSIKSKDSMPWVRYAFGNVYEQNWTLFSDT